MRNLFIVLSIFLAGCGDASERTEWQEKYIITQEMPHGMPRVWTTPNCPWPAGGGWAFHLRDGRIVMVSGSVTIEERK